MKVKHVSRNFRGHTFVVNLFMNFTFTAPLKRSKDVSRRSRENKQNNRKIFYNISH